MGMFSEITTEGNIREFVVRISDELAKTDCPETAAALRRLGRWALTQFEWSAPAWAEEFDGIFKEHEA